MKTHDLHVSEQSQRDLAAGVLRQAGQNLWRFYGRTSRVEGELYHDAYRWLTVAECSWPFSFLNVCQLLNLSPENVRQELIGDLSLGVFTYRARRCQRAASRFLASFGQLFVSEGNASASMPTDYAEARNTVFHHAASVGGSCLHENVN